jgi:hypothetical protein
MPHLMEVTKAANERSADVLLRELLGDRLITIDIVVPEVLLHVLACAHPRSRTCPRTIRAAWRSCMSWRTPSI